MANVDEYTPLVYGSVEQKKDPAAILQRWADETVAVTAGNPKLKEVMDSKAYHMPLMERPVWKDPERFLKEVNEFQMDWYGPTAKVGDIIGLSALYADVSDDGDNKNDLVGAASDFMLNVGIIATLLVGFQFGFVTEDAPIHPSVSNGAILIEEMIWGGPIVFGDSGDTLIFALQQLSTLWLLLSIRDMLAFIAKSTKMFGALMYWCADIETRVWFSRTWCIQESEGKIRNLMMSFARSLIPYTFLSRGPIIAIALEIMAQSIVYEFDVQVEIAKRMITYRLAEKAQKMKDA